MQEENLSGKEKKEVFTFFNKKEVWISGIIGLVLGAILIYILGIFGAPGLGNETIAKMKKGEITENELYKEMKKYYPITYALELVDSEILETKYKLNDKQNEEVNEQVDAILNQYKEYGYTEEQFLLENGFEDKNDFINYMKLDYRRNLCCVDYFKTLIPEENIKNYYNENEIYGKINTKHILVQISEEVTNESALATANEIIGKLNSGTSFENVVTEYNGKIISENVNFNSFDAEQFAVSYVEASKKLEKDTYTKEPVLTDYGYHIIYCVNKEEKPTFEEAENDIVEKLGENLELQDQYIRYKALIKLREENGLEFKDEKLKDEYEEYCKEINSTIE